MNAPNEPRDPSTILAALERAPLCAELARAERVYLARVAERREYAPGEWLFHEATSRHWLGVLEQGEVELVRGAGDRERCVAVIEPGDVLAGGVLLDDLPHATSARTPGGASVIQFRKARVAALRTKHPALFCRLASHVALSGSERLRVVAEEMVREAHRTSTQGCAGRAKDGKDSC